MKGNKNRAKSVVCGDPAFEEEMHELADAVIEDGQKTAAPLDPFEDYIHSVRTRFRSNPHIFRSRLVKGYNALLHELFVLQQSENSSDDDSKF
jgi:hypothetical protein